MSIIDTIKNKYNELSKTQKKIADYILNNQEDACFRALKKLSEEIGVSEATIIKFSKNIGCDSYFQLKIKLQENLKRNVHSIENIGNELPVINKNSTLTDVINIETESLNSAINQIDLSNFMNASTIIEKSKNIYIIGEGSCRAVRDYMIYRLRYMGFNAQEFVINTNSLMSISKLNLYEDVLFIIIDLPKYNNRIGKLTKYLTEKGIDTIAFAESKDCLIYKYAKITFICPSGTVLFFNSITSMIGVVTILFSNIALNIKNRMKEDEEKIEEIRNILETEE